MSAPTALRAATVQVSRRMPRLVRLLLSPPFLVIYLWLALSLFVGHIGLKSPDAINAALPLAPPGPGHWLGTDELGRDELSRILFGARDALIIGLGSVLLGAGVGTVLGLAAGYGSKLTDWLLMRLADTLLALPGIVIAMVVITILGNGIPDLILAIAVGEIPVYLRLVRGSTFTLRHKEFVEASVAMGAGRLRTIFRHILPNVMGPALVLGTIDMGYAILTVAGLTFIGLGPAPPRPEWGSMITSAQQYIPTYWWLAVDPGLAIVAVVLALNLAGERWQRYLDPQGHLDRPHL